MSQEHSNLMLLLTFHSESKQLNQLKKNGNSFQKRAPNLSRLLLQAK